MTIRGVVGNWNRDEGWGVIESSEVTGGAAWAHWSALQMAGYRELIVGEPVLFDWEEADQDGYRARATAVSRSEPHDHHEAEPAPSEAFSSSMRLDITGPATSSSQLPLPTVVGDGDDLPVITVPELEPLNALIVWVLTEGAGPEIPEHQSITIRYTGVTWRDGKVFDSSWGRDRSTRIEVGAGPVIPGLNKGLAGQRVGSRVVLVIPPDLAYGAEGVGESIGPGETLVLVVDLLSAEERNGGRSV